ncbi:hypothetical protein CCACVL1_28815 [Corchorus capsularis]|uniref:Uncharacterized protein n=1 Tax=Corchorus capsularis TaxID=210143 RepID=A0A1R3G530_COCAP|nr:hypothetical protein CCACVL1_28815 [Corchorus capsularis]
MGYGLDQSNQQVFSTIAECEVNKTRN